MRRSEGVKFSRMRCLPILLIILGSVGLLGLVILGVHLHRQMFRPEYNSPSQTLEIARQRGTLLYELEPNTRTVSIQGKPVTIGSVWLESEDPLGEDDDIDAVVSSGSAYCCFTF